MVIFSTVHKLSTRTIQNMDKITVLTYLLIIEICSPVSFRPQFVVLTSLPYWRPMRRASATTASTSPGQSCSQPMSCCHPSSAETRDYSPQTGPWWIRPYAVSSYCVLYSYKESLRAILGCCLYCSHQTAVHTDFSERQLWGGDRRNGRGSQRRFGFFAHLHNGLCKLREQPRVEEEK